MDPALYKAAVVGSIDPFENYQTCLDQLITPKRNTILHVYLENQSEEPEFTDFVDLILEMCPPLLLQVNIKGETPLHFAARYGHANVVKVLIDRAKPLPTDPEIGLTEAQRMMRMTNVEKDTALHEAARNDWGYVVEILTKEDPEFSYSANDHGETPLYIAINEGGYLLDKRKKRRKVIQEILRNCKSVDYGGPSGRTALHAAIMRRDDETATKLLDKEKNLTETTDQKGWSPLHYASYFSYDWDNISTVKLLLEYDMSAAYIVDTDKNRTALHIAAVEGKLKAMEEIVSCCPACCELVDNRGWNALHYVVARKRISAFEESLKIPELAKLKTEKDDKGNTPLHLVAALALKQVNWRRFLYGSNRDERLTCGLNKQNLSVQDIFQRNITEIQQKEILESIEDVGSGPFGRTVAEVKKASLKDYRKRNQEHLDKGKDAQLVVATLIATVTFLAALILPRGYKKEQGPNQAAFIVFVISDAISMVLSITAVFTHFWLSLIRADDEDEDQIAKLFLLATLLTVVAMGTMVIAFITGTCAVLATSMGLSITICLIGLSFFLFVFIVLRFQYQVGESAVPV